MAEFGSALKMDKFEAQKMIEEAVANSANLAEAMECVGAMYGIPATNIMVDDDLKTVKIMNDTIMCPSNVGAASNMNTIVRSIGAVLDQISSRINDKLNGIQSTNILQGRESDEVASRSDPSKGKVVATYKDSNGDILLVYDSGIIDAPQTPAGRAKAMEIRSVGNAPTINPLPKSTPAYFTDEDDLMNGVEESEQPTVEYSLSDMMGEDAYFLDAMARFGDTPNLGYAILTSHGYDCVQPTMNVVQEAADEKKSKHVNPEDIKYMKFDNSEIHKAIECLNKARKDQEFIKHPEDLDIETLVRSKDYQDAIKHLENQFDCKLSIKWVHAGLNESDVHTNIYHNEYRTKLTVSKSKGFQLGGAPINIVIVEDGITKLMSTKQDLFGQSFISVILHEIFHNISGIMRYENAQFVTSMTVAMEEAAATRDNKMRRLIIEKYVSTLDAQFNGKLGRATKRLVTKRLLTLVVAKSDAKMMTQMQDALEKDADDNQVNAEADRRIKKTIKAAEHIIKATERPAKRAKARGITGIVVGAISIIAGTLGAIFLHSSVSMVLSIALGLGGAGMLAMGITGFVSAGKYKKLMKKYKNSKDLEEYYADLMSGMYQLPQRFFIGGMFAGNKKFDTNDVSQSTLDEWVKIEKVLYEHLEASYPSSSERTWTGVTIAKKVLEECDHLDPNVKNYLKWVVDNNDKILKTGIKEDYNSHTFDPKEAEDLDQHLLDLIRSNKLTVTESAMRELMDSTEFSEWVMNGLQYTDDEIIYQEECDFIDKCDAIFQEVETSTKATGYSDEKLIKRILMFLPRLIMKCAEAVWRFFDTHIKTYIDAIYKLLTPNEVYKININIKNVRDSIQEAEVITKEMDRHLEGVKSFSEYLDKIGTMKSVVSPHNDYVMSLDDEKFTRFTALKGMDLPEEKKWTITGKQLGECIKDIHKSGDRMKPILKRLADQAKRLTKDEDLTTLTPEQKKNFEKITAVFRYVHAYYNTVCKWIIQFRRQLASDDQIKNDLKG